MKTNLLITAAALCILCHTVLDAQVSNDSTNIGAPSAPVVRRTQDKPISTTGTEHDLSVRATLFNELLTQRTDGAPWERVIYRRLDLNKEENAPLYYPERSREGMQNLFSSIFDLLNQGRIEVYEYLDGYEVFDEAHLLKFKDFLDRFQIMYTAAAPNSGLQYQINPADVPNTQVKAYYIKEKWYFDPANSQFSLKVLALCPILTEEGDFGVQNNMPLFWVPYENVRPFISRKAVMLSSLNNARIATLDDYFRLRLYKGDIVMADNLRDQAIAQYARTEDSIRLEQKHIEKQIKAFEKSLYVTQDSTWMKQNDEKVTKVKTRKSRSTRAARTSGSKPKVTKPKAIKTPKAPKASSGAARSVRSARG